MPRETRYGFRPCKKKEEMIGVMGLLGIRVKVGKKIRKKFWQGGTVGALMQMRILASPSGRIWILILDLGSFRHRRSSDF